MSKRSTPPSKIDEWSFPIRVLVKLPEPVGFLRAFGSGCDPYVWLHRELGAGNAALYSWRAPHMGDGYAVYFRTLQDAAAFLAAYPEFIIADGTAASGYNSPYVSGGVRRA